MANNHDWTRFHRDSRHAFGDNQRFQIEKPGNDWLWGIGFSIVAGFFLLAWVVYRTGT